MKHCSSRSSQGRRVIEVYMGDDEGCYTAEASRSGLGPKLGNTLSGVSFRSVGVLIG